MLASVCVSGSPNSGSLIFPRLSTVIAPLANPPGAKTKSVALRSRVPPATARVTDATRPPFVLQPTTRLPMITLPPAALNLASSASCNRIPGTDGGCIGTSAIGRPTWSATRRQVPGFTPRIAGSNSTAPSGAAAATAAAKRLAYAGSSIARANMCPDESTSRLAGRSIQAARQPRFPASNSAGKSFNCRTPTTA